MTKRAPITKTRYTGSGYRFKPLPKFNGAKLRRERYRDRQFRVAEWIRAQANWDSASEEMEFLVDVFGKIQQPFRTLADEPQGSVELNRLARSKLKIDLNDDYELCRMTDEFEIIVHGVSPQYVWGTARWSADRT